MIKLGNTTRTGRSGKELEKFDNPFRTMLSRNDPLLDSMGPSGLVDRELNLWPVVLLFKEDPSPRRPSRY